MVKSSIAIGLIALGASPAAQAATPDVTVTKIRAYGKACPTDVNGKPDNWEVEYNKLNKSYTFDFSDFRIDENNKASSCKISLILSFPASKTLYSISSGVEGEANIVGNEKVEITTVAKLGNKYSFSEVQTLGKGTDDDFETEVLLFDAKKDAPCGGKDYRMTIDISARLIGGNQSFAALNTIVGGISNLEFDVKDCKKK